MNIRKATPEDMKEIYQMSFDAWGGDLTENAYIKSCYNSEKYKLGNWYCLEESGEVISSLIIYSSCLGLADNYMGLGSISTKPIFRRLGYADKLIRYCIDYLSKSNCHGLFLFSEIGTKMYEKYNFKTVKEREPDGLMFLNFKGSIQPKAPNYF